MYLIVNPQPTLGSARGQMVRFGRGALRGCAPCSLGAASIQRARPGYGALRGLNAYRGQMVRPGQRALRGYRTLGAGAAQVAESTGITAASTAASFIPVVGPVLGPLIGLIGGAFFGASAARAKEATTENAAVNQLMPAAIQAIQQIAAQVNAGQLDTGTASSQLDQLVQQFQSTIQQYASTPGSAMRSCTVNPSTCAVPTTCDKGCTVGCCMLCNWLMPAVCKIKNLWATSGGTIQIPPTTGSHYGYTGTSGFSLSYTPSAAASGVTGALSSITSGTMLGLPTWVWLAGGGLLLVLFLMQGGKG